MGRFFDARMLVNVGRGDGVLPQMPQLPQWPHAEIEFEIEERAAIMEHDGGLNRNEAERLAKQSILGASDAKDC